MCYERIGARSKQTRCSVVGKAPISTNSVTDRLNMVCLYEHHRLKNYLLNCPEKFVNRSLSLSISQLFLRSPKIPKGKGVHFRVHSFLVKHCKECGNIFVGLFLRNINTGSVTKICLFPENCHFWEDSEY